MLEDNVIFSASLLLCLIETRVWNGSVGRRKYQALPELPIYREIKVRVIEESGCLTSRGRHEVAKKKISTVLS